MFFTYILQSETTGRYYIGSTDNLRRRLSQHNDPDYSGTKTTKRFKGPWKLVYEESFESRAKAMSREKQLKSWKSKKAIQELVKGSVGRVPMESGLTTWSASVEAPERDRNSPLLLVRCHEISFSGSMPGARMEVKWVDYWAGFQVFCGPFFPDFMHTPQRLHSPTRQISDSSPFRAS